MKKMAVQKIISVSAVGSMKEKYLPGHFVVPDQFIDRTNRRISTFFKEGIVGHVGLADPTCNYTSDVLFQAAKKAGIYEKVMLYTGRMVRHYGLNNHKEYFAESTEAYLGVNDFYPFVRGELKEHDPRMYKIMERVWGPVR